MIVHAIAAVVDERRFPARRCRYSHAFFRSQSKSVQKEPERKYYNTISIRLQGVGLGHAIQLQVGVYFEKVGCSKNKNKRTILFYACTQKHDIMTLHTM